MLINSNNNHNLIPGLYIVATPIGNLEDITIRALKVLEAADYIICEDTRVTGILLSRYGIKTKMLLYNDHSNEKDRNKILADLKSEKTIALVSDAGTPMISDPGHKLLKQIINEGIYYTSVPGACAAINSLLLSGHETDKFSFYGFLPIKQQARLNIIKKILSSEYPTIIYETAKKINKLLVDISSIKPEIKVTIVREMTKIYEEVITGSVKELCNRRFKGELVVILGGEKTPSQNPSTEIEPEIISIIKKLTTKDGQKLLKELYPKASNTELYNILKN